MCTKLSSPPTSDDGKVLSQSPWKFQILLRTGKAETAQDPFWQ